MNNPARHQREMERHEDEKVTSDVMSRDTTRMFVPKEKVSLDSKKDLDKFGGLKRRHEMELEKESVDVEYFYFLNLVKKVNFTKKQVFVTTLL